MRRFHRPAARIVPGRNRRSGRLVHPRGWIRRHWLASSVASGLIVAVVMLLWRPWQPDPPASPCGPGLTPIGTAPYVCVGLNLDTTEFKHDDPLSDLRQRLDQLNSAVGDQFATVVLLDNMTPDPESDSDDLGTLRHRIEGALTAVWRANRTTVAGGNKPRIKLLLASYGSRAESWQLAVEEIKRAVQTEHIVAVTGIGQSRHETRQAVAALSTAGIATVGSVVTADDMNNDPAGRQIENFVRVAPTNTDQARAALSFITSNDYRRVMLIQDVNEAESYVRTLASAFASAYKSQYAAPIRYTESYRSPSGKIKGSDRGEHMADQFAGMHSDMCATRPDAIYFAGRSADLKSFMKAMSDGGACGFTSLNVVTGDDASNLVGAKLPGSDHLSFEVFYTALAHAGQWSGPTAGSANRSNYNEFVKAFTEVGFLEPDLSDGHAMMSHDAALTAITTVRRNSVALTDPSTVGAYFLRGLLKTLQHKLLRISI